MSSSHIDSNLILNNTLLGINENVVAYFPFRHSANEIISGTPPITNSNTRTTENGIFIGEATTNIYGNIDNLYTIDANGTLSQEDYHEKYLGTSKIIKVIKYSGAPSSHASFRNCVTCLENTLYTVSWKIKVLKGSLNTIGTHFRGGTTGPNLNYYELGDGWYQFYKTGDSSTVTNLCVGVGFVGDALGEFLITEPQLEQSSFHTSYTENSRDVGKFTYNSSNFWNEDFSVFMDCKVNSTEGWRMVGGAWNQWYFSWYSNLVYALRVSWYTDTQHTLNTGTIEGLDCREWNNIGFTYDRANQTLKIYANGQLVATNNDVLLNNLNPNETSIGDISWDSHGYKLNGRIKNYIVFDKALTDEEVLQLSAGNISYSKEEIIL